MICDEANELLAAYSLSALPPEELAAVRRHLATCQRHDEALAELQAVAERLPLSAEEREPPPQLRARILEAFDAEAAARSPARPAAVRAGVAPGRRLMRERPAFAYLVAAALLVAVVGVATWNVVLQVGGDEESAVVASFVGESGQGQLVYLQDDRIAFINLELPEPPAGRVYQAWGIYQGGAVSLGLLPSQGVAAFSADLSEASAVAVSEEPEGGSAQPTTEPLLVAELD